MLSSAHKDTRPYPTPFVDERRKYCDVSEFVALRLLGNETYMSTCLILQLCGGLVIRRCKLQAI